MKVIEPGHIYELNFLDDVVFKDTPEAWAEAEKYQASKLLTFVNREEGHEHPGTQTQEVLRALIDRTYHCDHCMPDEANAMIIYHLRMALVYHEARALIRKTEKGEFNPELVHTDKDGHFRVERFNKSLVEKGAPRREFLLKPEQRKRNKMEY